MAIPTTDQRLTHTAVLAVAVPIIISNLSSPLLGLVDTGVVGQLGDPKYIGAVAVGALIFNFVYWAFGFLRMGTTGLTAQAYGAGNGVEVKAGLGRALLVALVAGVLIVALQSAIEWLAFNLIEASPEVETGARRYFSIRIWSAPFALANFAILGWLIGRQKARLALLLQLFMNGLNILLDAVFVLKLEWGVSGIAIGTMLAESVTAILGILIVWLQCQRIEGKLSFRRLLDAQLLNSTISVNRDIMIRSLFIMFAFIYFTAESARSGNIVLAVNTLLMQFVLFTAFFLDGFAFSAEALVGAAIGAKNKSYLLRAIVLSTIWAVTMALILSLVLYCFGSEFIDLLSIDSQVRNTARNYLMWAVSLPILSVWCWQIDGIFVGATRSHEMRNAAFYSLAAFFIFWWLLMPLGNHGLWMAMMLFNVCRALFLGRYLPSLIRTAIT